MTPAAGAGPATGTGAADASGLPQSLQNRPGGAAATDFGAN